MRWHNKALQEFERLRESSDRYARGRAFEKFVGRLLRAGHLKVVPNPGTAKPRQSDLLATGTNDAYLVETKWQRAPVAAGDIDSLLSRLRRTEGRVIGVFVSTSGFTREAINVVGASRDRPILLVDGGELEHLLAWDQDLIGLLRRKREELLVRGKLTPGALHKRRSRKAVVGEFASPDVRFSLPDGESRSWLSSSGQYGHFTFTLDLFDIDWVAAGGTGVSLDVSIPVRSQHGLLELIAYLTEVGWGHEQGQWSIEQSGVTWHGIGGKALVDALSGWEERYRTLSQVHHTEVLCYYDTCTTGYYTLKADLEARNPRTVWQCDLSFQLSGVPLDPEPFHQLASAFDVNAPLLFRPRTEKSVERIHLSSARRPVLLQPLALIVEPDEMLEGEEPREWVIGIVTSNPYHGRKGSASERPEAWPRTLDDSDVLICRLGSWHYLDDRPKSYFLLRCDSSWTSDVQVVSPTAEWLDDDARGPGQAINLELQPLRRVKVRPGQRSGQR
jgi:hypothetical protein